MSKVFSNLARISRKKLSIILLSSRGVFDEVISLILLISGDCRIPLRSIRNNIIRFCITINPHRNNRNWLLVAGVFVFWNCVGPEDPIDGLLDDLPAIVNTSDAFTFNLKGHNFSFEEEYTLSMKPDSNSILTTSLIVTNWTGNDTSRIFMMNSGDTTYAWFQIAGNLTYTSTDSLSTDTRYYPTKLLFEGSNFSGTMQFSLFKD